MCVGSERGVCMHIQIKAEESGLASQVNQSWRSLVMVSTLLAGLTVSTPLSVALTALSTVCLLK